MILTRVAMEAAFDAMSNLLHRRRTAGELTIFGQAAIVLQSDDVPCTDDVDVRIEGNHNAVERAAHEVADRWGWRHSWLNEGVTPYLPTRLSVKRYQNYPGLQVYMARPDCLLALKLSACRQPDVNDAVVLARMTGIKQANGLIELYRIFYPDQPIDPLRDIRRIDFIQAVIERC